MKKLALALMCFVSVAFFASCTQEILNPEPSITIMSGENYMYDGQTIDLYQDYILSFRAASNSQTMKELATFSIVGKIYDMEDNEIYSDDTICNISGTEYTYEETWNFGTRELVGKINFTATVTDVDGKSKSVSINLNVNQPAEPLDVETVEWYRLGSNITGLDEYGLEWKGNYPKDNYAKLVPADGVLLYIFDSEDWNDVTTDIEKAAFFNNAAETMRPADEYWEVNVTQGTVEYDDVIGTIMPDGTCHLMHVVKSHSETVSGQGTATTITVQVK